MSIQNRLHIVLKMHNLTASSFADKIGVQRSNVSHVLGGRNKPSLDFLEKILLTFPRVNANWLVTGKMNGTEQEIISTSIATSNPTQNDVLTEQNTTTQIDLNFDQAASNNEQKANFQEVKSIKKIEKIVTFYTDNTFKTHYPEQ